MPPPRRGALGAAVALSKWELILHLCYKVPQWLYSQLYFWESGTIPSGTHNRVTISMQLGKLQNSKSKRKSSVSFLSRFQNTYGSPFDFKYSYFCVWLGNGKSSRPISPRKNIHVLISILHILAHSSLLYSYFSELITKSLRTGKRAQPHPS